MGWDRGGGQYSGAVALEGERCQQPHAVELDPRAQPDAGRLHRRVDFAAKRRPWRREEELEPLQVGDVDLFGSRQGVVVDGDDQDDVLFEQRLGDEVAARHGEGEHGQIETARRQLGLEAQRGAVGHDQMQPGMAFGELGQEHGHEPAGGGAENADPYVAGHRLAQGPDVGHEGVELTHDPIGPGHHDLSVGGETTRRPVYEGGPQFALQTGHVGGDVGLDRAQMVGGGGERSMLGHRHQRLQVSEFHLFLR